MLMPASIQEWLPDQHLARFVVEIVDQLDLIELTNAGYHSKENVQRCERQGIEPYIAGSREHHNQPLAQPAGLPARLPARRPSRRRRTRRVPHPRSRPPPPTQSAPRSSSRAGGAVVPLSFDDAPERAAGAGHHCTVTLIADVQLSVVMTSFGAASTQAP